MTCFRLACQCAIGILLACSVSGCFPSGDSQLDEQKEPHFLTGKSLATQMDYQGAIDSFEKALEVNPRSASAHFELAWLYENKAPDPAAAIYHYDRFLKLCPKSDKADLARAHMNSCKMELARTVSSFAPWPASAQHDLENLLLENKNLKAQLAQYQAASANHALISPPQNQPARAVEPVPVDSARSSSSKAGAATVARPAGLSAPASSSASGTYTVRSGENPSIIARKCGVSVSALMAANPQARPTHLQVGQTLSIPPH